MGDLALRWGNGAADLALTDAHGAPLDDLATDLGLRTAVLLSLFTDRRAEDDDPLPADDGDRRGWWADEHAEVKGDLIGSRRWLLDRSSRRADVPRKLEEYDREALQWMIADHVTDRVDVSVALADGFLLETIAIYRPDADPVVFRFKAAWDAEVGRTPDPSDVGAPSWPTSSPPDAGFLWSSFEWEES